MNLLSLIIIFLAIVVCAAIGYIAWELTAEKPTKDDRSASQNASENNSSVTAEKKD